MRRAQFRIAQQVRHGAHHLGGGVGIEHDACAIGHFGDGGSAGAGYRAAAGHGLQNGQAEAFVEGWKHKQVAGVVQMQQIVVGDETDELDAVRYARLAGGLAHFGAEPGVFAGQNR